MAIFSELRMVDRIVILIMSILFLKMAVAVYSAHCRLLLVCTMLLFAVTVPLAGPSTCVAIFSGPAWWILVVIGRVIITSGLILLKVAVAVYSTSHYLSL